MSNFRDLIARMAIDAEFARHARANPDAVARQYHLNPDESEQLRGLADAAASAGPTALGARLSKMGGLISSSLIDTLHVNAEPISHGLTIDPAVVHVNPHVDFHVVDPAVVHVNPHVDFHVVDPAVVHLNPQPADPGSGTGSPGDMFGDNDGDGIPNFIDPTPDGDTPSDGGGGGGSGTDSPGDMFGDNDGDGIPNFIDPTPDGSPHPKLTNVHAGLLGPMINDPGGGTGDPTPPPADGGDPAPADGGDHTLPPGDQDGGHHESPPVDTATPVIGDVPLPQAAAQQPIMLADDALAKPVARQGDSGSGEEALIIGGAALAGGAIAGGVAGVVLNRSKSGDEE